MSTTAIRSTSGPAGPAGRRVGGPTPGRPPAPRSGPDRHEGDRWHALARRTEAGALAALIAVGAGLAVASEQDALPSPAAAQARGAATALAATPHEPSGSAPLAAEGPPAFLVRVEHEVVRQLANGVTRIERWQETLARTGQTVWIERILPDPAGAGGASGHDHGQGQGQGHGHGHDHPAHDHGPDHGHGARGADDAHAPRKHSHEGDRRDQATSGAAAGEANPAYRGHGHRHFDGDAAARWIEQGADGKVTLNLVDRKDHAIISIPRAEFRTLGFDGRFDASASLVPASVVATMTVDPAAAPVTSPVNARWYVDASDGWVHRVLWSDAWQLALRIDSRRDDGSLVRTVRVDPASTTTRPDIWPWQDLTGFERRRYDEYLD